MVEESGDLIRDHLQTWDYETQFREYVLLLGRKGKDALESIDNFPGQIELDTAWHSVLDRLRSETKKDGNERFKLIGFKENSRDFYISDTSAIGEMHRVPASVQADLRWKMWQKYKITSILGDLHTHPMASPFSPADLFGLLNRFSEPQPYLKGVVNANENLFAFRTRETFLVSQADTRERHFSRVFEEHWIEQAGYKFNEDHSQLIRIHPQADIWKANLGIAETHRLALYRGEPAKNLIRVYPQQDSNDLKTQ